MSLGLLGCLDTAPVVTGNRTLEADSGAPQAVVTDPEPPEAPSCVRCSAAMTSDRSVAAGCRNDQGSSQLSSQGFLNRVFERCCTGACAARCQEFCSGGPLPAGCRSCEVAECKVAIESCGAVQ